MTKTAEYGPDNPRDWDPNHPMLRSPRAPHETAGVLRAQRAGYTGKELMNMFRLRGTALMRSLQNAMDAESQAYAVQLPIHDARAKRC